MSQEEFDQVPTVPWFDLRERVVPNHQQLPPHLAKLTENSIQASWRIARRTKKETNKKRRSEDLRTPLPPLPTPSFTECPHYPGDKIDLTEECRQDYLIPSDITSISSRTSYAVTGKEGRSLETAPSLAKRTNFAIKTIAPELHEHTNTIYGIKDILLAQNRDVT